MQSREYNVANETGNINMFTDVFKAACSESTLEVCFQRTKSGEKKNQFGLNHVTGNYDSNFSPLFKFNKHKRQFLI